MNRYLVSFCNNGDLRLAIVTRGGTERTIVLPTHPRLTRRAGTAGILICEERIIITTQADALIVLNTQFKIVDVRIFPEISDLHGLGRVGNRLLAVSTGTNQLVGAPLPDLGDVTQVWSDKGSLTDRHHLNDVHVVGDNVLISMFNTRMPDAMRSGSVFELATGNRIVTGLREPHSPFWWEGALYVLESATGDLLRVRAGFAPQRVLGIVGYPRGLSIDEQGFVIGKSAYRDASRSLLGDKRAAPYLLPAPEVNPLSRSGVLFVPHDGAPISFVDTTEIGSEIYQIARLPDAWGEAGADR